ARSRDQRPDRALRRVRSLISGGRALHHVALHSIDAFGAAFDPALRYAGSSAMRYGPCSKVAPVTFPLPSSWNSMAVSGQGAAKRVSERATRGPSGALPDFTNNL